MNTERLIAVMLAVAIALAVLTFMDGYAREKARMEAERSEAAQDE